MPASGTPRRWWRWLLLPPLLFLAWLLALWPLPSWYRTHWPAETAFMRMRRAQAPLLRGDAPERRYQPVPLERIGSAMPLAAVTGEDANFFEHGGIDYEAIRKALGYRRRTFSWDEPRDRQEMRRAARPS